MRPWKLLASVAMTVGLIAAIGGTSSAVDTGPTHYATVQDVGGANDQPGQKDLTLQGGDNSSSAWFDTFIQWDESTVSGGNTLDGCSLIDTDGDGNANAAVCATLNRSGTVTALKTWTIYRCTDTRADRCSGGSAVTAGTTPVSSGSGADATTIGCERASSLVTNPFNGGVNDTRAYCTIDRAVLNLTSTDTFNLINSCSYPSAVPNSDPSDCVLRLRTSAGYSTSAVNNLIVLPNATLNLTANSANDPLYSATNGGTVTFRLYKNCGTSQTLVYESAAINAAASVSTSNSTYFYGTGALVNPSPNNSYNGAGTYAWTADYSGNGAYNPLQVACFSSFTAS